MEPGRAMACAQRHPVMQGREASTSAPPGVGPLEQAATDEVRREWMRRVAAEYRSSAHTQHLTLWLIQLGAPRELIDDGLRIVADELDHAELSAAVFREAGGNAPAALQQNELLLEVPPGSLEERALFATLEVFCLGETVAVPLFTELRKTCTVAVAREALDRVLKDEVRHRQFGWDILDYLLERSPTLEDAARRFLPGALQRVQRRYGQGGSGEVSPAERAWGLMAPGIYREILDVTVRKEYEPRFRERSLL
jgi:hypothetical protein